MIRSNLRSGAQSDETIWSLVDHNWAQYYQAIKDKMSGTQEEKELLLRRRIQRFFQDYKLQTEQYYTQRRDIDPQRIDLGLVFSNALLLYGIDFLTLNQIRLYFAPYLVNINIYDDSHCSVQFTDAAQLLECLNTKLVSQCENPQILEAYFSKNPQGRLQWRQIKGYKEMVFERKLWARFLTKEDPEDINNGAPSRYMKDLFNRAKLQFLNSVNKTVNCSKYSRQRAWRCSMKIQEEWENREEKCRHCQEKFKQVKKMYPCNHKHHAKKEQESEEERGEVPHPAEKRRKYQKKNVGSFREFYTQKFKPNPIIEKLTGRYQSDKKEEDASNPAPGSELYSQMMHEFSRYELFGDKTNVSEILKNQTSADKTFMNRSDISIFEKDDSDI